MSLVLAGLVFVVLFTSVVAAAEPAAPDAEAFPRSLESYEDDDAGGIWAILKNRVSEEDESSLAALSVRKRICS